MKRTRKPKPFSQPTAILTSDIELRSHPPLCRTDDHWAAQARKIAWLCDLQKKYNCPVIDGGDLFDKKYKQYPNHELLGWAAENLPDQIYTVPGNHDLPGKSIENYSGSAMAVLERAGKITVLKGNDLDDCDFDGIMITGFPWGVKLESPGRGFGEWRSVAIIHAMIYEEFEPFPGCQGYSAKEVIDLLPDFDLIVTGDNHQTFVREDKGRLLVNPGSFMRNDADQIDHKPCVFLWYAEENGVEQVFIPIEQGVVSREHIDEVVKKEERLSAFMECLGDNKVDGIDFENNLRQMMTKKVAPQVQDMVWKFYETK